MNEELNEELISAYLDDELEGAERDTVKSRLDKNMDDECLFNEFRQLGDLLRELPREPAPAGMAEVVRRQLERQTLFLTTQTVKAFSTVARWSNRWLAGGLASVLMLCFGSYYLFQQQEFHEQVAMTSPTPIENTYDVRLADTSGDHLARSHSRGTSYFDVYDGSVAQIKKGIAQAPQDHFDLQLNSSPFAEMESHDFVSNGLESLRENENALELTEIQPPTVQPESMAGVSFSTADLPPPPPIPAELESSILARLNESPKLGRKLQTGELVRLLKENDSEVALVELSVVDVRLTCGQVQMLLVQNNIAESPSKDSLNAMAGKQPLQRAKIQAPEKSEIRQSDGFKGDSIIVDNLTSAPQSKVAEPAAEKKAAANKQELIAFYVDAPTESVLNSLSQLESLDQVQKIHVGEAPHLSHDFYSVVPMNAESTLGESLPLMVNVFNRAYYGNGRVGESEDEALSHKEAELQKPFRFDQLEMSGEELLVSNNGRQLRFLYSPVDNREALESIAPQQNAEEFTGPDRTLTKPAQDQKQISNPPVATTPFNSPEGETKEAPVTTSQPRSETLVTSLQDKNSDYTVDPQTLAYQVTVNLIPLENPAEESAPKFYKPGEPTSGDGAMPVPNSELTALGLNQAEKQVWDENGVAQERKSGVADSPFAPNPELAAKQPPRRTRMVIVLTPVKVD